MRGLLSVVLIAGLAWGGWWFFGATAQKSGLESWFSERRAAGWTAEYEDLEVTGFPNRFDTILTAMDLKNPEGWGWNVPQLHVYALSYKPNHIIAAIPDVQAVATPTGPINIVSTLFQSSLIFKPETSLALDRWQLEVEELLAVAPDWKAAVGSASFALVDAGREVPAYNLYIQGLEIKVPKRWRKMSGQRGRIPETHVDATLIFDRPLDRFAVENGNPSFKVINIRDAHFEWGSVDLNASGRLTVAKNGRLNGDLTFQTRDWRSLFEIAKAAGLIPRSQEDNWETGLTIIAGFSGNDEEIEAAIRFERGEMFLGIIPLGPAPRF